MRLRNDSSLNTLVLEGNRNLLSNSNTTANLRFMEDSSAAIEDDKKIYMNKSSENIICNTKKITSNSEKEINFNKILTEPFLKTDSIDEVFEEKNNYQSDASLSKENKSLILINDSCSDGLIKQDKFYSDKEKERLYKHLEKLKLLGDEQYDLEDQCKI